MPPLSRMKSDHTIGQSRVLLSNRRPVRAQTVPIQGNYPPHDHEFYEICLVTGGRARHRTVEGDARLARGSVLIVAPGQLHAFAETRGFSVINVYYLAEWFLADLQALQGIDGLVPLFFRRALFPSKDRGGVVQLHLDGDELAGCLRDLEDMEVEGDAEDAQPLFLEAGLLKYLIRLSRAAAREKSLRTPLEWPAAVSRGLEQIERAVRHGEALGMEEIARGAGASFSHFCRIFKGATGVTPGEYFQRRRIHRACRRLLSSDISATEIAHLLGFADSAHFSRRFKATTGMTPREYRKKFRGRDAQISLP